MLSRFNTIKNRRTNRLWPVCLIVAIAFAVAAGGQAPPAPQPQPGGASVIGTIQDDRGAPVADARVAITSTGFSSSALTQADGRFEFRGLQPGEYRITAEAARFRKGRVNVTVARPDEVLNPVIRLTASSLRVAVVDASNQPLRGVVVSLATQDRGGVGAVAARTTTDEGGDAYFGRLSPGPYQLTAALRGYEEKRTEVFISSDLTTDLPLQLLVAPVIPINEKSATRYTAPSLPSKNVQAVFQDSEGWIWLGTDKGLARFNGTDFKSSASAGSPYASLGGEDIRSIAEDAAGTIWLATPTGVRQITKTGTEVGTALDGQHALQIFVDSQSNVWVATTDGLFKFDGKAFTLFNRSRGLSSNDVRGVAEDKSGRLWAATASGLMIFEDGKITAFEEARLRGNAEAAAAEQRDSTARAGAQSRSERSAPAVEQPSSVNRVFVDAGGNVWFASERGVSVFDGSRVSDVALPGLAGSTTDAADSSASSGVLAIGQDSSGRMWFAPASGGALIYDPAHRVSQRISSLDRDRVAAVFTGREGNVWFGTNNGAVQADYYSFVAFTTSRGLSDNDVRAVIEYGDQNDGGLWFLTSSGVSRLDGERFVQSDRLRSGIGVRAVAFDHSGAPWFATEQGAFRLSGQILSQFNESKGLASNNVHWVTSIEGGARMIFATSAGASLFEAGEIRPVDKLDSFDVRHVFEAEDGVVWFATSRGIVSFDPRTSETDLIDTARGLADNDARWISSYRHRLVVATRAGVQFYNATVRNASAFATLDGDAASTLFVDRDGYLWVGTDDGQVKKFAQFGDNIVSTIYSGDSYALNGSRINSIFEDSQRRIWIATSGGAVRHSPVRVAPRSQVALEVDGSAEAAAGPGPHDLSYGRQRLTFRFTAVSMNGQVRYLYRINPEQGDHRWTLLPVQQEAMREVSLFGIDSGNYTFQLISLNRDLYQLYGEGAPVASVSLRVAAPLWQRWWFYTIALALVGLIVASAVAARRIRDREYVLPKELRSFVPIEPNPYIVGNPIRSENMFYGREDDFRYVRTKLENVNQGVVIVFCGERRVGKSSILYQVLNGRLGERFIPVFVDMQEMVIASDSEFFARICRLIAEAVTASGVEVGQVALASTSGAAAGAAHTPAVSVPEFDGRNPYPLFLDFLDEVLAAIGDRELLILIDEYELMEAKVDEGKLSSELFTYLAGLMDNKERLAFIFTGSRRLEERDKKYWRELLRRSLFRKVSFLSEKDCVRLVTEPVVGRVVFGRGTVEEIYRLTAGQPFYTQVICQNIVDYMNEHRQNWLTVADLKQVIADIVDNPLPQMIYAWDGLSDDEKLALSLLSEMLVDNRSFATAHDLRAAIKAREYPVNLSETTIRLTLEEMFRRELLDKDAGGGFRVKIDLFRLWIRRSHSIWQVVKEVRTL